MIDKVSKAELVRIAKTKGFSDAQISKMSFDELSALISNTEVKTTGTLYKGFNFLDPQSTQKTNFSGNIWSAQQTSAVSNEPDLGFVRTQIKPQNTQQVEKPVISAEQAQDFSIEQISQNTQSALNLFLAQEDNQGIVSKGYDEIKNLLKTKLSSTRINKAIDNEVTGLNFLSQAKEKTLSKREYYEQSKQRLLEMIPDFDTLTEAQKQNIKDRINSLSMQGVKELQHKIAMLPNKDKPEYKQEASAMLAEFKSSTETPTIEKGGIEGQQIKTTMKVNKPNSDMNSDELISYEEVFKYERGVEYSKDNVQTFEEKKAALNFVSGAKQKYEQLKQNADDIDVTDTNVLKLYTEYFGDSKKAQDFLQNIAKEKKLNIQVNSNPNGRLTLNSTDKSTLKSLLKGGVEGQEAQLNKVLNGKSYEQYQTEYATSYTIAYGTKNAEELAKAYGEDQENINAKATGAVQIAGMGSMVIGGVACLIPGAQPIGAGMISVGGKMALGGMVAKTALDVVNESTRKNGMSDEAAKAIIKEAAINAGSFAIGMGAGATGAKVGANLLANGSSKLVSVVAERGVDFTISVLGDMAMIGNFNVEGNMMGVVTATAMGLKTGKTVVRNHITEGAIKGETGNIENTKSFGSTTISKLKAEITEPATGLQSQIVTTPKEYPWRKNQISFEGEAISSTTSQLKAQIKSIKKENGQPLFSDYTRNDLLKLFTKEEDIQRASILLNAAKNCDGENSLTNLLKNASTDEKAQQALTLMKGFSVYETVDFIKQYGKNEHQIGFLTDYANSREKIQVRKNGDKIDRYWPSAIAQSIKEPCQREVAIELLTNEKFQKDNPNFESSIRNSLYLLEKEDQKGIFKQMMLDPKQYNSYNIGPILKLATDKTKSQLIENLLPEVHFDKLNKIEDVVKLLEDPKTNQRILAMLNKEIQLGDIHSKEEIVNAVLAAGNDEVKLNNAERVMELNQPLEYHQIHNLVNEYSFDRDFGLIKSLVNDKEIEKRLGRAITVDEASNLIWRLDNETQVNYLKRKIDKNTFDETGRFHHIATVARRVKNADQEKFVEFLHTAIAEKKIEMDDWNADKMCELVNTKEQADLAEKMLAPNENVTLSPWTVKSFLENGLKTEDYNLLTGAMQSKNFANYGESTLLDVVLSANQQYKKEFLSDVIKYSEKVDFDFAMKLEPDDVNKLLKEMTDETKAKEVRTKLESVVSIKPEVLDMMKKDFWSNSLADLLKSDISAADVSKNAQFIGNLSEKHLEKLGASNARKLLWSDVTQEKMTQNIKFIDGLDQEFIEGLSGEQVTALITSKTDVIKIGENKKILDSLKGNFQKQLNSSWGERINLMLSEVPTNKILENKKILESIDSKITDSMGGNHLLEILLNETNGLKEKKAFLESIDPTILQKFNNHEKTDLLVGELDVESAKINHKFIETLPADMKAILEGNAYIELLTSKTELKTLNANKALLESLPSGHIKTLGSSCLGYLLATKVDAKQLKNGVDFVASLSENQAQKLNGYRLQNIIEGKTNLTNNIKNKKVLDALDPKALELLYSNNLVGMMDSNLDTKVLLANAKKVNDLVKNDEDFFRAFSYQMEHTSTTDGGLLVRDDINFDTLKEFSAVLKENEISPYRTNLSKIKKDETVFDYLVKTEQIGDFNIAVAEKIKKGKLSKEEIFDILQISKEPQNFENFDRISSLNINGYQPTLKEVGNLSYSSKSRIDRIVNDLAPLANKRTANQQKISFGDITQISSIEKSTQYEAIKELMNTTGWGSSEIIRVVKELKNHESVDMKIFVKDFNALSKLEDYNITFDSRVKLCEVMQMDAATMKSELGIKQNVALYNLISKLPNEARAEITNAGFKINDAENKLGNNLKIVNFAIQTDKEAQKSFFKNFLANNNKDAEEVIQTYDFNQFGKNGVPMAYPRDKYVADIDNAVSGLSTVEKESVLAYFGMNRKGTSFEGIPKVKAGVSDEKFGYSKKEISIDKGELEAMDKTLRGKATSITSGTIEMSGKTIEIEKYNGTQGGSNFGYFCKAKATGELFYIKYPENNLRAREEVLAAQLYKDASANSPELSLFTDETGNIGMASKVIPGLVSSSHSKPGFANQDFAADAWLANWDVACNDNISSVQNTSVRVDVGGALRYRARGEEKGAAFNKDVEEFSTLLDGTNTDAQKVFANMTREDLLISLQKVANVSDEQIKTSVNKFIIDDGKGALIETLIARRNHISEFLNVAKQTPRQDLDMPNYIQLVQRDVMQKKQFTPEMNSAAKKIAEHTKEFSLNNEAQVSETQAKIVLNGLLKGLPEFTTITGKKQHNTHAYSVDIHTLKVLQSAMNDPNYAQLSDKDKTILKISTLLHDLAKQGDEVDHGHATISAQYTNDILAKFNLSADVKERIVGIISYHHWFAGYNKGETSAQAVATEFRRPEDYKIARIIAKADMSNVNADSHLKWMGAQNEAEFDAKFRTKTDEILPVLESITAKANIILDTKIIDSKKIPLNESKGVRILDMNDEAIGNNLEKYGFGPGVTKESARFTVHMVNSADNSNDLSIVKLLMSDPNNKSVWSTSMIGLQNKNTYSGRTFGVLLDTDMANISEASYHNTGSGTEKGIDKFSRLLNSDKSTDRTFVKDKFIKAMAEKGIEISGNEYQQIAKYLISKKHLTQVNSVKIGDKVISAEDMRSALTQSRDALFEGSGHNEIVSINPRVKGLIAKVATVDELPHEFINFARQNNLPIILLGK